MSTKDYNASTSEKENSSNALDPAPVFQPVEIYLPDGLPSYEQHKTWLIEAGDRYLCISAKTETKLRSVVVRAADVMANYEPDVSNEDVAFLDLQDPVEAEILLLVSRQKNGNITVNLQCPIVFNLRTLKGRLISPVNKTDFAVEYPIFRRPIHPNREPEVPQKYWTCQERHKVQLRLDGRVRACCMLPNVHWAAEDAFRLKNELNNGITTGKFGVCEGCTYLRKTEQAPNDAPMMIDIMTNSFCSVRCWYCCYTIPGGMTDAPPELRNDKCGVSQHVVNTTDIPTFVRDFAKLSNGQLKVVSLSGGDSAFHPQFKEIAATVSAVGAKLVYLSAGILPPKTENFCIDEIRAGRMFLSISPDAANGETWSKVKRMNSKLWTQLVSFVSRAAQANSKEVIVKRILLPDNLEESETFINFWHSQGVRQFALSALFDNKEKQLSRTLIDQAITDSRLAIEKLQRQHGQPLHFETIAI